MPLAKFFEIDNLYIMCTKPPACVLFKPNKPNPVTFEGLEPSIMPVFPIERSITLKGYSVRRKQVPMCPAFCLTNYKVQALTLTSAILDLKDDPTIQGQDWHRKFWPIYVQLSRLQYSKNLYLLQKLDLQDLQFRPDPQLPTEMQRLQDLESPTCCINKLPGCISLRPIINNSTKFYIPTSLFFQFSLFYPYRFRASACVSARHQFSWGSICRCHFSLLSALISYSWLDQ
jgi:hypothetical protein